MIFEGSPKAFIQCFNACLGKCSVIAANERAGSIPAFQLENGEIWIIGCGNDYFALTEDADGEQPLDLSPQGQLSIFIRVVRGRDKETKLDIAKIARYSLVFTGLAEGDGGVGSLRYDLDPAHATPNSPDWDEELQDNVAHPLFHLHVNFHASDRLRLALGQVSPMLVLRNFASWYAANQ